MKRQEKTIIVIKNFGRQRTTADKRLRYASPKLPLVTSFIHTVI